MPSKKQKTKKVQKSRKQNAKKAVGISKPAFRRVARKAGIRRVPAEMYVKGDELLDSFFRITLEGALMFTENRNRKTIQSRDVRNALIQRGRVVYGVPRPSSKSKRTKSVQISNSQK